MHCPKQHTAKKRKQAAICIDVVTSTHLSQVPSFVPLWASVPAAGCLLRIRVSYSNTIGNGDLSDYNPRAAAAKMDSSSPESV